MAATVLTSYFARLDDADADACAELLAPQVLFLRQSLGPDGALLDGVDVLHGRDAVRASIRERGRRPYGHRVTVEFGDGTATCVEGLVRTDEGVAVSLFLARADLGEDGLITRYLAIGTALASGTDPAVLSDADPS